MSLKISSKHWEAMKKLLLNDGFAVTNPKPAEPPKLFGIPVVVDDSIEPGEVKLWPSLSPSYQDRVAEYFNRRAALLDERPQAYAELMGLEAAPTAPKPKQIELRYCACNHLLEHHADSGGVCVMGVCSCSHFSLKKVEYVNQTPNYPDQPKYLGSTGYGELFYTMGVDWGEDDDKTATALMAKQQLEAQASVAEASNRQAASKVKVVKKRRERKLALDKDM